MASINIRFPLNDDLDKNGLFSSNAITKEALESNLILLLLTRKGERYYQPDYGTNLIQYLFEPKDNFTLADIEEELRETVSRYIPQLTIDSVDFFREVDVDGIPLKDTEISVEIGFTFTEDAFSEQGTLTLAL